MKDLTHYFMEVDKSFSETKIHQNGRTNNNGLPSASTNDITPKKRGRVKIKISQKNNEERICDIIETKHDLVDKTPSPFTSAVKEKNKGYVAGQTPKRSDSQIDNCTFVNSPEGAIYSPKRKSTEKYDDMVDTKMEEGKNSKRAEGSNAFQLLMTRSKPVQYLPQKCTTPEEEALHAKKAQEVKAKIKQNKEKLTELADKKGYTKRKLAEAEEAERIEKRLDKRAKVFKRFKKDEESPPINQNQKTVGGLHNYFSTMTPEEREKEKQIALSTVTVKVEVHSSDGIKEKSNVVMKPKNTTKAAKNKTRKVLAAIDDIQVLRSETPSPPPIINQPPVDSSQSKPAKKTKWSLRINLSEVDDSPKDEDKPVDDKITPKVSTRSKRQKNEKDKKSSEKSELKISKEKETISNIPDAVDDSVEVLEVVTVSNNVEKLPRCDSEPITNTNQRPDTPDLVVTHSQPLPDSEKTTVKTQKLAPLFVKRQKPTAEVLAARKSFLWSKSPEDPKKKPQKKIIISGPTFLPFPSISHVTQMTSDECEITEMNFERMPSKVPCVYKPTIKSSDFAFLNNSNLPTMSGNSKKNKNSLKSNVDDVLNEMESKCPDIQEMWQAIKSIHNNQSTPKESPKRRGRKKKSLDKNSNSSEEGKFLENIVWTQKYRPMNVKQIVGNEDAAAKLKSWLEAWRTPAKDDYSSSEEFYSSDNSFQNGLETNQVAVLLGPHGSGKTASVYAIAEELGYTVLELNASSKRPGKKILKDFEEATKSHRIKKSDLKTQVLLKNEEIPQNSLILVEDVDLVFDEDEGFVSATCQLATNTKRPIVMTCRSSCTHLSRLAPQQMKIHYQEALGDRVRALLELITLVEAGTRLPPSCLDKLSATGDLRKALLQLQYLILSGSPQTFDMRSNIRETLWQDVKTNIYKPAIKCQKKMEKKEKAKETETTNESSNCCDILDRLANDLDTISVLSNFIQIDDRLLNVSQLKFEPSLSLIENEDLYSRSDDEKMEISEWLKGKVMERYKENVKEDKPSSNQLLRMRKELNFGVNLVLSQVVSNNLDSYPLRTDYLPTVRTICRAEDRRISSNAKRGNRFFHYLQSLRLPSASTKPNILAAACKIFWDNEQCGDI